MKKLVITLISFLVLASTSYAMNTKLQDEVLNVLVEFEAGELAVEYKFNSTEMVYLKRWPNLIMNNFADYLYSKEYLMGKDLTSLDWVDPSGEYSVSGKIQRSLQLKANGETAYIAYYLFVGGEWGREEVYHQYFVLNDKGNIIMTGIFERNKSDFWGVEENWD